MATPRDPFFKIDVEAHLCGDNTHISYYPGYQAWWRGVHGVQRAFGAESKPKVSDIAESAKKKLPEEDQLIVYTGFCWVPPGRSKYCLPIQLDEVATDFPNLTIIAYHAGWPYHHDLNMVALRPPTVYISR